MKEIVICWALCMWLNGNLVEHSYTNGMSDCLKKKRLAERTINPQQVKFACGEVKAEIEHDNSGTQLHTRIVRIIDHQYKDAYK